MVTIEKKVKTSADSSCTANSCEIRDAFKRQAFPEFPPHVEYSMTELGLSLGPIYQAVHNWEQENLMAIYKCRRQYDEALT